MSFLSYTNLFELHELTTKTNQQPSFLYIAGVKTPHMDDVIMWSQEVMGKEYLKDGKVAGKDIDSTRAPQHFGFDDLDKFMAANRYIAK